MSTLPPEKESELAHNIWTMQTAMHPLLVFIVCALVIATTCGQSNYKISWDNYPHPEYDAAVDEAIARGDRYMCDPKGNNRTLIKENIYKDRAKKKAGLTRVSFGTSAFTYCYLDRPVAAEPGELASLLRLLEFRPITQALLRAIVLLSLTPRMLIWWLRLRVVSNNSAPSIFTVISLAVLFIESIVGLWMTSLNIDLDEEYGRLVIPFSLRAFGAVVPTSMIIYLLLDLFDNKLPMKRINRSWLRVICLSVFLLCHSTVVESYMQFFERKQCQPYVLWWKAIVEYLWACSVLVFSLTTVTDLKDIRLYLAPFQEDVVYNTHSINYSAVYRNSEANNRVYSENMSRF